MHRIYLLLATLFLHAYMAHATNKKDASESWSVSSLKQDDFQKKVMESTESWLVAYYDSTQSQADVINKVFEGLAQKNSNLGIFLGTIDCTSEKKLCKSAGLRMLPTIQLVMGDPIVNPYSGKKYRNPQLFEATQFDARGLEKFISKNYPASLVTKIASSKDLEHFFQSNTAEAPKAAAPVVILFTEKDTVTMIYKSISHHFRGRIKFLQVSIDKAPEVAEKYGITETTLGVIAPGDDGNLIKYENDNLKNRAAIIEWLKPYDTTAPQSSQSGDTEDDGADSEPTGSDSAEIQLTKYSPTSLDLDTVSTDYAYLLAVVRDAKSVSTDIPEWPKLVKSCEGRIKAAILECEGFQLPKQEGGEGEEGGSAPVKYSKLGERACAQYASGTAAAARPYLLVVPYGTPARKRKLDPALPKWATGLQFTPEEHEKAKSAVGDSLPDTGIRAVPEEMISQFFGENMQQQKNSIVFMSRSHSLPTLFKNIALHHSEMAEFAFVVNPSEQMLAGIGKPKLPAVFGIPAFDPEEVQQQMEQGGGLR
jgi:hypothetical protein